MTNNKTKGFILGAIAAASYGMNPLFTLPLYSAGMSVDTVLFYRYSLAVIVLWHYDEISKAIFCHKKGRCAATLHNGIIVCFLFFVPFHELQLYGCRHCFYHSVCLSGISGYYYGGGL